MADEFKHKSNDIILLPKNFSANECCYLIQVMSVINLHSSYGTGKKEFAYKYRCLRCNDVSSPGNSYFVWYLDDNGIKLSSSRVAKILYG